MQAANLCALFITAAWVRLFLPASDVLALWRDSGQRHPPENNLARASKPMPPQTEAIVDEAPK
jgi:hypothetical protein